VYISFFFPPLHLLDRIHFSNGDVNIEVREFAEHLKMRIEMGVTEIPNELIQKAEMIVHKVSLGFRT